MQMPLHSTLKRIRLREWWLFLFAHAAFALLSLAPLLFGTSLFIGLGLGHSYPFFSFQTIQHLLAGDVAMNQFNMNGFSSLIPIGFSTNPLTYLFTALLPTFDDIHWFVFTNMVAGGVLCSIMLRRFGISKAGSIVGGSCFMTGCWWLVVTPEFSPLMPVLPLIVFALLKSRTYPTWAALWGSLLSAYIWLGVPTQVSLMLFSAFGVGGLFLAWSARHSGWNAIFKPLIVMAVSMGIGTLLGIIKVLPPVIYGELSWRAGGLDIAEAASGGLQPLTIFTYLFPYASFPFLNFGGELLQVFIGAFGFAFLLIGLRIVFMRNASTMLRWWVAAYVLVIILAFQHSPLATLLHSIPPFSFFRGAGRWTMMSSFAVAPIIGFAFDALMNEEVEKMRKALAVFFGWLAIGCCIALGTGQIVLVFWTDQIIAFFQDYFAYFHKTLHLGPPLAYYTQFVDRRIHELITDPLILSPRALFPFLSLLALAIVLQTRVWRTMKNKTVVMTVLCLLTSALSLMWYNNYFPRKDLPHTIATVEFLKTHPGTALGIFSNGTAPLLAPNHHFTAADDMQWTLEHLVPNSNLFSGISVLDYFDNIASRRHSAMAAWVGAQWVPAPATFSLAGTGATIAEQTKRLIQRKDLLDVQSVRYIVSSFPLPRPFVSVFNTTITSAQLPVMIYENPTARPRVYFADELVTMPEGETEALNTLFHGTWAGRKTLIECEPSCPSITADRSGTVGAQNDRSDRLTITTDTNNPQWLIVTVSRLPGWRVSIDGVETDSFYANGSYFGIPVPAGKHTVGLQFSLFYLMKQGILDLL